ncbi:MAG TPA: alpha/beta fold hydrolase [Acidimicrobiales bacterium]|nr:alpha/beta fold hydrolase [Acidimicrobiales bacterium]
MRRLLIVVALALVAGGVFPASASAAISRDYADPSCVKQTVPVSLGTHARATYRVVAWLCGAAPGRTVIVSVSGTTYNHTYWDFPVDPGRYSFVRALTAAGYAVLNFDRIGIGESDHPAALASTGQANAWVMHTLVRRLRSGAFGGVAFPRVVSIGHSQGSAIVLLEAETYHDVNGLIDTGLPGVPIGSSAPLTFASLTAAQLDPAFSGAHIPLGYTTTRPGTRQHLFFDHADPAVVAADEALKDLFPAGEATVLVDYLATRTVRVPVFSVYGEHDRFFCDIACTSTLNPTASLSPLLFSPAACLESVIVPGAGHDINLHRNAPAWYAQVADWIARRVGATATLPPSQPCSVRSATS